MTPDDTLPETPKRRGRGKGVPAPRNASPKSAAMKQARVELATELYLKTGIPQQDIAKIMGVTRETINRYHRTAEKTGVLESVRTRIAEDLLPKAMNVYEEIIDSDPHTLTRTNITKAQELRLKAAQQIAAGIGALRKESSSVVEKKTINLDGYMELRKARHVMTQMDAPLPTTVIDGEVRALPPPDDSQLSLFGDTDATGELGVSAARAEDQIDAD